MAFQIPLKKNDMFKLSIHLDIYYFEVLRDLW